MRTFIAGLLLWSVATSAVSAATKSASGPSSSPSTKAAATLPKNYDGFFTPIPNVPRESRSGIYAIWYTNDPAVLSLPFISGGQVMERWAPLEPKQGQYDWTALDAKLAELAKQNRNTTVQVNGNEKPLWMFDKIPYHPERISYQIQDKKGTLMFWHPLFEKTYLDFIAAFAKHIKESPYRKNVIGVRMNFNALGTEGMTVDQKYRSPDQWIVPEGATQGPAYSDALASAYHKKVMKAYIDNFDGVTTVLLRGGLNETAFKEYGDKIRSGKLAYFFTGASHKPSGPLPSFFEYCRRGLAFSYSEPYGDAWGNMGGRRIERDVPPASAIYWQTLLELHCGVSIIACYGNDLEMAYSGKIPIMFGAGAERPKVMPLPEEIAAAATQPQKVDEKLKQEFLDTFEFGAKYVGYHASPEIAPGAWVAMRQLEKYGNPKNEPIAGDCTFLMKRLADKSKPVTNVGDAGSRFYAYARVLPKSEKMTLVLDPLFAKSLTGKKAGLNVIYFDGSKGTLQIEASGQAFSIELKNSGGWQRASFEVPQASFGNAKDGGDIVVTAGPNEDVMLHMIEVTRE